MLENFFELFFPRRCMFCDEKINERYTCGKCLNIIEYYKEKVENPRDSNTYYDKLICCIKYSGKFKKQMLRFKFRGAKYLSKGFAEILYEKIIKHVICADLVVPVPISLKRRHERGYNQSELLAKYLAAKLNLDYTEDILVKRKNNLRQSELDIRQRVKNVQDVYSIKNPEAVKGKSIILIDDICTTGATLNECSRILKLSEAKNVIAVTVMYSELENDNLSIKV